MLRQQYFMGEDVIASQLVEEAREIYYTWNCTYCSRIPGAKHHRAS